jgi:hypothetical protein
MKRAVPDWLVQLVWFLAGVYATGALWYFLSRDDSLSAALSFGGAVVLTFVAVQLHRLNDRTSRFKAYRERLGGFIKEAEVLLARSAEEPLPIQEYTEWAARVENYLTECLDASYGVRFGNFSGMTFYGDGSEKSTYENSISGRSTRLHQFITEFSE